MSASDLNLTLTSEFEKRLVVSVQSKFKRGSRRPIQIVRRLPRHVCGRPFEADAEIHLMDVRVRLGSTLGGIWWSYGKVFFNWNVPFRRLLRVPSAAQGDADRGADAAQRRLRRHHATILPLWLRPQLPPALRWGGPLWQRAPSLEHTPQRVTWCAGVVFKFYTKLTD